MPTYRIEGKRVKTDKPLSDAEIDEIGAQIRGAPPVTPKAPEPSGIPIGRVGVGAETAPAMALLSPEQKRQALEIGAQVAALGAGGAIGGAIRGGAALFPRVAPYLEPLAAAVESGGFRSG